MQKKSASFDLIEKQPFFFHLVYDLATETCTAIAYNLSE